MTGTTNGTALDSMVLDILALMNRERSPESAITTRYPFTYAYDYARSHSADLKLPDNMSRGEAGAAIRKRCAETGESTSGVIEMLADAYLEEHGLELEPKVRRAQMEYARQNSWKSLGLKTPPGKLSANSTR